MSSGWSAVPKPPAAAAAAADAASDHFGTDDDGGTIATTVTAVTPAGPQRYTIRGVSVDFPYPAYDCQQVYMEKASLASQLQYAAYGQDALSSPPPALLPPAPTAGEFQSVDGLRGLYGLDRDLTIGGDVALSSASGAASHTFSGFGTVSAAPSRPKIIYASRTHSQLAKVASELKHTIYRPKMTILGSRSQLCVHPVVSQLEGVGQTQACRALTADKACNYREHLETWSVENSHLQNQVLDIEDLVTIGKEQHMCPYFYSRDRMADAELVLLPYNYLIDPTIRSRLGLKMENSLLVFDEAHNLEGVCGDSASFDLSAADIAAAIQEVQKCIDVVRDPATSVALMEGSTLMGNDVPDIESLVILKTILLEFEQLLDRQPLPDNGDGLTQPGEFIFDLLAQCKIQQENKDMLIDLLDKSVTLLFSDRGGDAQRKSCAMDKFSGAIKIIFKGGAAECVSSAAYYRVHIHTKEAPRSSAAAPRRSLFDNNPSRRHVDVGRILSYWCFNPGVAMQDLTKPEIGVRCMILTSGTLSPMESFAYELKLPFPIRLENPHVIQAEQIWVGILEKGPASQTLNSGFKQRDNADYINDLGNAIVNFSRVVPDGLLVFFPSYSVLSMCHAAWQVPSSSTKSSIVDRITKHKALVVEPRTSAEFASAINDFESRLDDPAYTGAVFFAVCRGKVSEGLDFADRAGRAVIVTGLPYPAFKDPKVRLKRLFLDEAPRVPGIKQLTGMEWYGQQAARAVNQAIGRVIRHRGDYGAVILADGRFGQQGVRSQLSRWIRPYVQTYNNFGVFAGGITKFFKSAQINYPEKPREKKVDGLEQAKKLGEEGHLSVVRQAEELGRASKAWTISAITQHPTAALPTIRASAMRKDDWNESYAALTDGLTNADAEPAKAPAVHVNPTLIKKHPTSLLMSLLKPASTTTQTHTTPLAKATASPAPAAATNRLLRMSSLHSSSSSAPVKIELEVEKPRSLSSGFLSSSQGSTVVKSESSTQTTLNQLRGQQATRTPSVPLSTHAAASTSHSSSLTPAAASSSSSASKPASSVIKEMIARVKSSLTAENFNRFKATLQKLSELKSSTATSDNFFQHVAAINATVRTMASLLFGFNTDVLAEDAAPVATPGVSPLDSSLANAFEPHIPVPFRPQYSKAVKDLQTRFPRSLPPAPRPAASSAPPPRPAPMKTEPMKQETTPRVAAAADTTHTLKREFAARDGDAAADLPPPRTQQEFIARVKARLDQQSYGVFKSVILTLESAPTPSQPQAPPPQLLQLFQRLQAVLNSPPLLRAYADLIPQRLRPTFQSFLSARVSSSQLRWTGTRPEIIDVDADDDAAAPAPKRTKTGAVPFK